MVVRKVKKVVEGMQTQDGAGVKLTRVISLPDVKDFDPFLLLDAFDSKNPADYIKGFPWHPHRGIETVTYLIKGDVEHGDSLGHKGKIKDGACQWMTAGQGIIHQEMPQACEHMLGAQLWINLPKKHKMTHPAYNDIQPNNVPKVEDENARVAVISGEYKGVKARMQGNYVKTTYLDVELNPNREWEAVVSPENTAFIYVIDGNVDINDKNYPAKIAILFDDGDKVKLKAGKKGTRFLFLSGKPLREPVAWGGPIVMNTDEELMEAFKEIELGTFVKGFEES